MKTITSTLELLLTLHRVTVDKKMFAAFDFKFHAEEVYTGGVPDVNGKPTYVVAGWLVQIAFTRPDANTGVVGEGHSRKEFVPIDCSPDTVVKTAWLLIELLHRHELMEAFLVDNHRVFNPHHTVAELQSLRPPVPGR